MEKIKAIALDFDGVLTDGTFIWGPNDEEYKKMSFLDVMGISLGKKGGLLFAIISGEDSPMLDRFAKKMGIVDVYKGCKDKAAALRGFAQKHNLDLGQVCFVGDDVNDVPALELAGLAVVPATAHAAARSRAGLVTKAGGGQGAVREVVDVILAKQRS
ncbi:MAG: HAD family hydrolase [Syntrophales bacterium]|nr:HAD family hydrolase [Syntrophales bacterium]